jgi:tRNA dimethylallyltransferase
MYRLGLLDEVRGLLSMPALLSDTARQAIGYAEAIELIENRCTLAEAMERTAARTRRLAKRQRTWLRTQADVRWIEAGPGRPPDEIAAAVAAHWEAHGPTRVEM